MPRDFIQTLILLLVFFSFTQNAYAFVLSSIPLERGFAKINFVSEFNLSNNEIPEKEQRHAVIELCSKLTNIFKRYSWNHSPCGGVQWKTRYKTDLQNPLLYATFGEGENTTLILGGVHPDELTPIHLAFRFARFLNANPEVYQTKGHRVVIAPLVNPDGFLKPKPSRTNLARIDVNRNFLTLDWYEEALQSWLKLKRSDYRFFPGYFPNTEIETIFQAGLIKTFQPNKILSIHAPLGFYDYDGPGDQINHLLAPWEEKAKLLVRKVAEKSQNYRIVDYSFYPGSLGNFAGNERKVPTLTLELETTDPTRVDDYWDKFLPGFLLSVEYPYSHKASLN